MSRKKKNPKNTPAEPALETDADYSAQETEATAGEQEEVVSEESTSSDLDSATETPTAVPESDMNSGAEEADKPEETAEGEGCAEQAEASATENTMEATGIPDVTPASQDEITSEEEVSSEEQGSVESLTEGDMAASEPEEAQEEPTEDLPEPEPEVYVGPNDDMVFREDIHLEEIPPEEPLPISEAARYLNRRVPGELNNSAIMLNRVGCNLGDCKKKDRYLVTDRYVVLEYGYLSRIPLSILWRIVHGEDAKAVEAERAKNAKKKKRHYGLMDPEHSLEITYTEAQWRGDLARLTAYIHKKKGEEENLPVCLDDVWLLSEFDFRAAFLHRATQAIRLIQLAILAEARQNRILEETWENIRQYKYRVQLEKSKGGIFTEEDAYRLRCHGIRYLNDLRKHTVYEIKNTLIEHDMCHVVEEINDAFREDLARRRDRRLQVGPFLSGFINLIATGVVAYMYQYTLIKNQLMTVVIIALLALWAITIPTILFAAIRAVYRRHTRRKDYYYFNRPVRITTALYSLASIFILLSCVVFYERYDGYDSQYFYRDLEGGSIAIAGRFNKQMTSCEIPSSIDGKPVTEVDLFAFYNSPIHTVTLPESIQRVDTGAFMNCSQLKNVTLNQGLSEIGNHAFRECLRLNRIELPSSVTSLGTNAFRNAALTSIDLSVTPLTELPEGSFRDCIYLTELIGLEQITVIGDYAFNGCQSLPALSFSSELETIGEGAFAYCNGIMELTVPNGVTSIGKNAFDYCQNLRRITLPFGAVSPADVDHGSLNDIVHFDSKGFLVTLVFTGNTAPGSNALRGIDWVEAIILEEGITEIHSNAFSGKKKLKSIYLPSSLEKLGDNALRDCTALTEISGGESLRILGKNALRGCEKLTEVGLPALEEIGENAFRDCMALDNLEGLANATTIGDSAFRDCVKLNRVTFSESLTDIGAAAFRGCHALVEIRVPSGVTSIGLGAFTDLPALKSASVPFTGTNPENSLDMPLFLILDCNDKDRAISLEITAMQTLERTCFRGCSSVSILTVGDPCQTLEEAVFKNTSIREITLPESLTAIPKDTFKNCDSLTTVKGGLVSEIGESAFENCKKLVSVAGIATAQVIQDKAFKGCSVLENVTFSEALESIGKEAFRGCSTFTAITVPKGTAYLGESAFAETTAVKSITVPFAGMNAAGDPTGSLGDVFACGDGASDVSVTITVMTDTKETSFAGCTAITRMTIASPMTRLGSGSFAGLSVQDVILPDTLTAIGSRAFADCAHLKSISGTDNVVSLEESAFFGCRSLTAFDLTNVQSIGNTCFEGCPSLANIGELKSVNLIGANAFKDCSSLKSIILTAPLEQIPESAFAGSGITEMVLPETVTALGKSSFRNCIALVKITLPAGLNSIGEEALRGCTALTEINTDTTALSRIDAYAFADCTSLSTLTLPVTVTRIPEGMAQNCRNLSLAGLDQLPLTEIGGHAFENCSFLNMALLLGEGLMTIGEKAFYGCSAVSLYVPDSVNSIGSSAFDACPKLAEVVLPYVGSSVDTVGAGYSHVFGTTKVQNLTLTNMTVIEDNTFKGAENSLRSLTLNEGVTEIQKKAFRNFSVLSEITLPETLTLIGASAFENCTSLSSVRIPAAVAEIPAKSFKNCTGLKKLELVEGNLTVLGSEAFRGCTSLKEVTFPTGVVTLERNTFRDCISLVAVTFSDTMTDVHKKAFTGCNPATVNIPENLTSQYAGLFESK